MNPRPQHNLQVTDLGRMAYAQALDLQTKAVEQIKLARQSSPLNDQGSGAGGVPDGPPAPSSASDKLLLVEHDPPVITIGRGGDSGNLLVSPEALRSRGFDVHESSRGGDVTYHGPGQMVAYPILDLNRHGRDVHQYLRKLEQTIIDLLATWDIAAGRDPAYTGVWVGREKVCAIGVAITRWVSYHGLALNVSTDLDHFALIVPCGIRDRGVTSLARRLGQPPDMAEVHQRFLDCFATTFGFDKWQWQERA